MNAPVCFRVFDNPSKFRCVPRSFSSLQLAINGSSFKAIVSVFASRGEKKWTAWISKS